MYALMITAKTNLAPDEIPAKAIVLAQKLIDSGAHAGLVFKTFVHNGSTIGGFHLFESEAAAKAFLEGAFWKGAKSAGFAWDIEERHYQVAEQASIINGTPTKLLAEQAA